jgi:hypothetical protein
MAPSRRRIFQCRDLPQSNDCFALAFPAENTEAFQEGHNQDFTYFGDVPRTLLYDNARIAVTETTGDGEQKPLVLQPTRFAPEIALWRYADNVARHTTNGATERRLNSNNSGSALQPLSVKVPQPEPSVKVPLQASSGAALTDARLQRELIMTKGYQHNRDRQRIIDCRHELKARHELPASGPPTHSFPYPYCGKLSRRHLVFGRPRACRVALQAVIAE